MSTFTKWLEISPLHSRVSSTTTPLQTGEKLAAAINVPFEVYLKPT